MDKILRGINLKLYFCKYIFTEIQFYRQERKNIKIIDVFEGQIKSV